MSKEKKNILVLNKCFKRKHERVDCNCHFGQCVAF